MISWCVSNKNQQWAPLARSPPGALPWHDLVWREGCSSAGQQVTPAFNISFGEICGERRGAVRKKMGDKRVRFFFHLLGSEHILTLTSIMQFSQSLTAVGQLYHIFCKFLCCREIALQQLWRMFAATRLQNTPAPRHLSTRVIHGSKLESCSLGGAFYGLLSL